MREIIILLAILLTGCNSSRLVNSYKSEHETPVIITKLLVVGITPNVEARENFEYGIQKALKKKNIVSIPSFKYLKINNLLPDLSKAEVDTLEKQLVADSFNAVLLTRVLSVENKQTLADNLMNHQRIYQDFKQDYLENQLIYGFEDEVRSYKVFHTETALYHISEEHKRELVWQGTIDIIDPENIRSSTNQYVKLLVSALMKEEILEPEDLVTRDN